MASDSMTDGLHSGVTERQRGVLGALVLMLALVVGQFVTLERKVAFRTGADPAMTRATPGKAADRLPQPERPLSAGGGAAGKDSWILSHGTERRVAKAKASGVGGDPAAAQAFLAPPRPDASAALPEAGAVVSFGVMAPAGAPRHDYEGRAPPAPIL